jgi:aspartyl-tRNA(Asn)/glutamyl-tRNA(Gln) amidotransferase subunit B
MPRERRARLIGQYGIGEAEALLLTSEREVADLYERVAGGDGAERSRSAANWIVNDLMGLQRARGLPPERLPLDAEQLGDLLDALADGALTARAAKELLPQIAEGERPRAAAERLDLLVLDEVETIRAAVLETMAAFPTAVSDYRQGKTAAIGRLIGETIRRTGGRASPDQVRRVLGEELARE